MWDAKHVSAIVKHAVGPKTRRNVFYGNGLLEKKKTVRTTNESA
jgi:hypothetical protein